MVFYVVFESVFKLGKAFSTLAKKVPTFPRENGPKTPKILLVGVTSCITNGTGKAGTQLWATLTPYSKTPRGEFLGKKRTRMGSRTVLIRVATLTQREKTENKNGFRRFR